MGRGQGRRRPGLLARIGQGLNEHATLPPGGARRFLMWIRRHRLCRDGHHAGPDFRVRDDVAVFTMGEDGLMNEASGILIGTSAAWAVMLC